MKIVASYKFKGNVVERNETRIESIDKLANSDKIKDITYRVSEEYKNFNYEKLRDILLNELFFEEVEEFILNKYINKLYENKKNINIDKFIITYKRYAERGLLYTIDKVIRGWMYLFKTYKIYDYYKSYEVIKWEIY